MNIRSGNESGVRNNPGAARRSDIPDQGLIDALDGILVTSDKTGRPLWRAGGFMELFFPHGHKRDQREAMVSIWQDYFELFRDHMTHYLENDGKTAKPIHDGQFPAHFRDALAELGEDQWFDGRLYGYHGEVRPGEPTHYAIGGGAKWDRGASERSTISAYFPSQWMLANTAPFIGKVLDWCGRIKPLHGMCGLSMVRHPSSPAYSMRDDKAFPFLKRFPGLDYVDTAQFNLVARSQKGIRGVNWLTMLDSSYIEQLGGRDDLAAALSVDETVAIHDYDGGVLIQAGPMPVTGGGNAGRFLEHYGIVAPSARPPLFQELCAARLLSRPFSPRRGGGDLEMG